MMITPTPEEVIAWFRGRIPADWATGEIDVEVDRDEIVVTVLLSMPELSSDAALEEKAAAGRGRIDGFREDTRRQRMKIAGEAEARYGRKVSWAASCGPVELMFTHLAVPAMTRLRMSERKVLDTLVESGVARSRAEALAWCVKLVGQHEHDWLEELRGALEKVREVRRQGPA
jgi:hypothetical protein